MKQHEYDKIPGLNWSALKLIGMSPARLRHAVDHPEEREDKEEWVFGRAMHCALLEPERFDFDFVVMPKFSGKGSVAEREAWRSTFYLEKITRPEMECISEDQRVRALRCADAVRKHKKAMSLLSGAITEQCMVWVDADTGIQCKGRADIIDGGRIIDLKTTRRDTVRDILRDAASFDYHGQCAFYHDGAAESKLIDGRTAPAAIFVHSSKTSSFIDVAVIDMELDGIALDNGRRLYRKLIQQYAGCIATNWWPGMGEEIEPWRIPMWKLEGEIDD